MNSYGFEVSENSYDSGVDNSTEGAGTKSKELRLIKLCFNRAVKGVERVSFFCLIWRSKCEIDSKVIG